jgi:mono/diheme cytochrome c family protein
MNTNRHNKATIILACTLGLVNLQGCSSDDVADAIADEFITVSGTMTDINGAALEGVNVEGVYTDPGAVLNPSDDTDANGDFSLQVLKNDVVYLRATKSTYATVNSAKEALSASVTGLDIGIPSETEAKTVIDTALGASTTPLANEAWLVVDIEDANGDQVSGQSVISTRTPSYEVYTDCDGTDSGGSVTVACPAGRDVPMYIAYFDATGDSNIKVGTETQTAPLRMGEIVALEFTTLTTAPTGSFAAGLVKYDADCAGCHGAGSHDPVDTASDLYNDGEKLALDMSSINPMGGEAIITQQELLDLTAFLEDPSIM